MNKNATAGFWLGLFSIFMAQLLVVPVLAIIFSSIGLSKDGGRWYAGIGLFLGVLYLIMGARLWLT